VVAADTIPGRSSHRSARPAAILNKDSEAPAEPSMNK